MQSPTETPTPDQPKYDAFISYSHRDEEWVRDWLLSRLEEGGLRVCIDFRDFEPGAPSITEMEQAVLQSRKTLLVLTPNYLASEWAEFENILAATLDPAARRRRIIPLFLEPCELPVRIRALTYVDFAGSDHESQLQRLLAAVVRPGSPAPSPSAWPEQRGDDELEVIKERIEGRLVTGIMTADGQIDRALPYVALARKGMNQELLGRLTGWTPEVCAKVLSDLEHFSFAEIRAGDGRLFLHDEKYDLVEKQVWSEMEAERARICKIILDYYDASVEQARDLPRRQDLMVERLYYQLLADPRQGYARYMRLSDSALFRHDEGLDRRLRDEVLWFCDRYPDRVKRAGLTREFIGCDSKVRRVKRLRYTGRYEEAIRVAEEAKTRLRLYPRDMSDFGLARADLDVTHALALIYTGKIEEGEGMLKAVIADLEGRSEPGVLARRGLPDTFEVGRRNHILGEAHNNLGYVYRTRLGHYGAALDEFLAALPYFLALGSEEEIANTYDNMGRAYALLGAKTRAELLVRNGLEIRRCLGREFRIALSLNSQAIVYWNFGDIHRARRVSEQALHIFKRLGASRGIGLAHITLGRSLRRLGTLWRTAIYSPAECHQLLEGAMFNLQRADDVFSGNVDEPVRLVEIHNELGCAHRERAALLRSDDPRSREAREEEKKSEQCLREAVRRAEGAYPVHYVDSCDDLAQIYFQRGDFDGVEEWLNRAVEAIPGVYKIKEGSGVRDIPSKDRIEEFWWQMGKVEMLRGHMVYDRESDTEEGIARRVLERAMRHYALSVAYFWQYSEWAAEMRGASERLYDSFRHCRQDDLTYLQKEVLPSVASTHHLDASRLQGFFKDTLGLALQIAN